jgi:hypothetical protein
VRSPLRGAVKSKQASQNKQKTDDLCDQDSVVGSDGVDGLNDESGSDCFGY